MTDDELDAQIEADSRDQVPPFAAPSVRLARNSSGSATGLLLEKIRSGGPSAFIALEALRESDLASFERLPAARRAAIYVGELRRNLFYNSWGLPGYELTPTSHALIALGEDAVEALSPVLLDTKLAPLSGSEEATTSEIYRNRICDYAWVFISEIRGSQYHYSENVAERDACIRSLVHDLKENDESSGSPAAE